MILLGALFINRIMNMFSLNTADYIQIAIFCALLWYSIESHFLRKWQKKQVQLTILDLDMRRVKAHAETPQFNLSPYGEDFPIIVRKIYELGKFDPKILYSRAFHQPLSFMQKVAICIGGIRKHKNPNKQ